jgi:cell wall-associated NlpC family hydrolase
MQKRSRIQAERPPDASAQGNVYSGLNFRSKKRALFAILITFIAGVGGYLYLLITSPDLSDLPPLKNGDIVFQTSRSNQSLAIMLASQSLYTHIGIIRVDAHTGPMVIETAAQVRETPLQTWIARGIGARVTIKRISGLSASKTASTMSWAEKVYGKPYDRFFLMDDRAFYCSELVYDAFKSGAGVSVGRLEKVADLHLNSTPVKALIKKRWKNYPLCDEGRVKTPEVCLDIIKSQDVITPVSISRDPKLETLYSNYGFSG